MTPVNINMNAGNPFELFYLTEKRAEEILDHIAMICERACESYEEEYRTVEVVKDGDGIDTMQRLNTAKVLTEMLEIATTENEKNYVLFMSNMGITRVNYVLFKEQA